MTVFLQKEELKSLKNQYFSIIGQHSQFPQVSTPWKFSTMQRAPEVPQTLPIPQPGGTSILRLKEIIEEEERNRKRKGKAKKEPKEIKRPPERCRSDDDYKS